MRESDLSTCPIIIGGSHRSGTTLLRRILNGHSGFFSPAEIKFHKDLLGQFPNDPLAHGRLGASISALGLEREAWLDEFGRAFVRCIQKAATAQGKRRWVDKNPENAINILHWDRLLDQKLFFVLIVRHPLDIMASMEEAGMRLVLPGDAEGRAAHIHEHLSQGLQYAGKYPERSCVIRYEDLVQTPIESITALLTRVQEQFEPAMLENLNSKKHGQGLEDPKITRNTSVLTSSIGRWRASASADEVKRVRLKLSWLMDRFHYRLD